MFNTIEKANKNLVVEKSRASLQAIVNYYGFSDLIEFKDNFLCGNWKGFNDKSYGALVFIDNSEKETESFVEIKESYKESAYLSSFNLPEEVKNWLLLHTTFNGFQQPTLKPSELSKALSYMHSQPNGEKLLEDFYSNIDKDIDSFMKYIANCGTFKECPYALYIYGNDNLKYVRNFSDKRTAWQIYEVIKEGSRVEPSSLDFITRLKFHMDES